MFDSHGTAPTERKRFHYYQRTNVTEHSKNSLFGIAETNTDSSTEKTDNHPAVSMPVLGYKENVLSLLPDPLPDPRKESPPPSTTEFFQDASEKSLGNLGIQEDGFLEMFLRSEKSNSWSASASSSGGRSRTKITGEKKSVSGTVPRVRTMKRKTSSTQPLLRTQSSKAVMSPNDDDSDIKEQVKGGLTGQNSGKSASAAIPAQAHADPQGKPAESKGRRAAPVNGKKASPTHESPGTNKESAGRLVPRSIGRPNVYKHEEFKPENLFLMRGYMHELHVLMAGPSNQDTAEQLYQLVAKICTDEALNPTDKLQTLMAQTGKVCGTVTEQVNDSFDAWIIDFYTDKHQLPKFNEIQDDNPGASDSDKQKLIGQANDNGAGKQKPAWLRLQEYENKIFEHFKKNMSFSEKLEFRTMYIPKEHKWSIVNKRRLRRAKLIRMMHRRLSPEERQDLRVKSKAYYDALTNSALPVLHIAIKNESPHLVRAYLHAVLAFAPPEIKIFAIEARQYQYLPAFYYAMTHSTTTMIEIFMEVILESKFLYLDEKTAIILSRRPDPDPTGTYGIGGFYIAMAMGDIARAEAYMRQVYAWDTNCEFAEITLAKCKMLLAKRAWHNGTTAKEAVKRFGHKRLKRIFEDFVNSSRMTGRQKDGLYHSDGLPVPAKLKPQGKVVPLPKEARAEFKRLLAFEEPINKMPELIDLGNGVKIYPISRAERGYRLEREASYNREHGLPVPDHLIQHPYDDVCLLTITDVKKAGIYSTLASIPNPVKSVRRPDYERDDVFGLPPPPSREYRANSWILKNRNNTLPQRSASYASGLVKLPASPSTMSLVETIEPLSPVKLRPRAIPAQQQVALMDKPGKLKPRALLDISDSLSASRSETRIVRSRSRASQMDGR